ncbi:hypothetical protein DMC30DRAFT_442299 [Rhodotorula diobovata]|uniref:EGF-like domain-containing protein n=1 Tax=Rhodotorula diobovata TaxID=5288 RepID=A0A5C5G3H0_9BASI|nr:hypothetical protein DMC30DRAFT_442299 [Rhodotorula diobovata]
MLASPLLALALARLATAYPDAAGLATTNATLPAVCTPDLCLQGDNSLTAGVFITGTVNGSTQRVTLLPGTFTSSSLAASNASSSISSAFSKKSSANANEGFSSSGSLASSLTVSLQAGLTVFASALYQGAAAHLSLPSAASNSTASYPSSAESLLLTSNTWAVVQLANDKSSRLVVWDSIADVGELDGGRGSGGVNVIDVQARGCSTPCSSGGVCTGNGTCACLDGFTGSTCGDCTVGFYGKTCEACPAGCSNCDDGITGTGLCLDVPILNVTLPSVCDCANGICASNSTSATCECSAGWTRASNGTQCAACATGYYMSPGGDCLACDPSCASCSSPSGTCLTCQDGLQPLSSDDTKCTTATTASTNGTFVTCSARTYWDASSSSCVDCNPLCETCFKQGTDGCLSCRSPNVLMPGGTCVAMDSKTGVCDGNGKNGTDVASGWVYDNTKLVCDALPAKCAAGGVDNFSAASTRSGLKCSKCLPGSYHVDGACVDACPDGTLVSSDGLSCQACDSSCATCSISTSHCTSCASSSALVLNGTCISGSSCPAGYFALATNTSTCLACHPDCATCSGSSTACLTCPSSRPVLTSSGSCVPTCASSEYYDTAKSGCVACSASCATCSASGSGACLSCPAGQRLTSGSCRAPSDGCAVIDGFGVCLEDLVTVAAESTASETSAKWRLPWWLILVIVLVLLAVIGVGVWLFRRSEQKRRRAHTARFAKDLGDKEVDKKLAALPISIAYPPLPRASSPTPSHVIPIPPLSPSGRNASHDIPLTPRATTSHFVLEDPSSPVSSYAPSSPRAARPPGRGGQDADSRWSLSSYGSRIAPAPARRVEPQETGASVYSQRTFVTQAGNTLTIQSRNPFIGRM